MTSEQRSKSDISTVSMENIKLKEELKQQSDSLIELKLHEKRLMYLIYLAIENGHPIDKIYEEKVGKIPTERFQKLIDWENNVINMNY